MHPSFLLCLSLPARHVGGAQPVAWGPERSVSGAGCRCQRLIYGLSCDPWQRTNMGVAGDSASPRAATQPTGPGSCHLRVSLIPESQCQCLPPLTLGLPMTMITLWSPRGHITLPPCLPADAAGTWCQACLGVLPALSHLVESWPGTVFLPCPCARVLGKEVVTADMQHPSAGSTCPGQ